MTLLKKSSKNQMKMQKSAIFVKKKKNEKNIWKIKNTVFLKIFVIVQGSVEPVNSIYNLDYSVTKNFL